MTKWEIEIDEVKKRIEQGACADCNLTGLAEQKPCDCCRLLDNDDSIKLCKWCGMCDAWICETCATDYIRRGIAFFKRL